MKQNSRFNAVSWLLALVLGLVFAGPQVASAAPVSPPLSGYGGEGGGGSGGGGGGSGGGGGGGAGPGGVTGGGNGECSDQAAFQNVGLSVGAVATDVPGVVKLNFFGGNAVNMAVSNSPAFTNASQIPYNTTLVWQLDSAAIGEHTVYVRFYNRCGLSSPIVTKTITYKAENPAPVAGTVLGTKIVLIDELIARLSYGDRTDDAATLQSELKRLGYLPANWRVTKSYGLNTRRAVSAYLNAVDVTKYDLDALIKELKPGKVAPRVILLQRALKAKGFFSAKFIPTTFYGPLTQKGVAAYLASK